MTKQILVRKSHPGHPWIFSNEIFRTFGEPSPGDIVEVWHKINRRKEFLGMGFYNPHSLIAIRLFSQEDNFTAEFIRKRLAKAVKFRDRYITDKSFRLVHGESDGLPGLIVDKYENGFVIQINCLGMEQRKDLIVNNLFEMFSAEFIYEKSDTTYRKLEGLEPTQCLLHGQLPKSPRISQDGIDFLVNIEKGHKTGFYFDQRENRRRVRDLAAGRKVLDLFCYTGGFALYALKGGAKSILGVDASIEAVELARANARENNISSKSEFVSADVFEFLRERSKTGEKFDLIVLDPPAFTKSRKEVRNALKGYKDINIFAMKALAPDGILVTSSCSHHIFWNDFISVVNKAQVDADKRFTIIGKGSQAIDHPVIVGMPESEYLKCLFLQFLS